MLSYVNSEPILLSVGIQEYNIQIFQTKKSFIKNIKKIGTKSPICYSIIINKKIIHACYLFRHVFINYLLGYSGYHVIGDCFTLPEYRGRGLYPNMLQKIATDIDKKIVIYVASNNYSSIKGIEKAGFKRHKEFILYKFFNVPIYAKEIKNYF